MGQPWLAKGLISLLRLPAAYIPGDKKKANVDFLSSSLTRLHAVSECFSCFVVGCGGETRIKVLALVKFRFAKGTGYVCLDTTKR